jgi:hypothetical protein
MESYDGSDPIEQAWREGLRPDPLLTVSEWGRSLPCALAAGVVRARPLAGRADAVPEGDHGLPLALVAGPARRPWIASQAGG